MAVQPRGLEQHRREPLLTTSVLLATVSAFALAAVHIVTPSLRLLAGIPRSVWLSLFGGTSVAYVFVHLLPELARAQARVTRALGEGGAPLVFAERHVYIVALVGLALFYGLERLAVRDRRAAPTGTAQVFWVHMGSFGIYNAVVGYLLLHRPETTDVSLAFFAVAMALHFVVTDFGLYEHHRDRYRRVGRWLLVLAVLAGFGAGLLADIPEPAIAVLIALLAGAVILNVLKEEVPAERQSRFWAFALGLALYTLLLLAAPRQPAGM